MTQITSVEDIKHLGSIMVICAHPDDETYIAGGIIAAAVDNGQEVVCITATKGEAGTAYAQGYSAERLGEIRAAELEAALEELGVKTHYWLGCADGCCCDESVQKMSRQLTGLIQHHKPDSILTFGPDGLTGHEDHKSVSGWVRDSVRDASPQPALYYAAITNEMYETCFKEIDQKINLFFNIKEPPIVDAKECSIHFRLDTHLMLRKEAALQAMPSQTTVVFQALNEKLRSGMCETECFVKGKVNEK